MKNLILFIVVLFSSLEGFSQVADKKVFGKLTVIDTIITEKGYKFPDGTFQITAGLEGFTSDSLLIVNFDTLYKETLLETDFTTSTKWTTFGNFSVSGGKAVFSGTSGTIRQKIANLAREGMANKTYQFTYTSDSIDWIGCIAFINTDFASFNDTLILSDGIFTTTFTSNSDPGDFKIECACTSGGFTFDDVSLKIKSDSIVFIKNDIYAGGIFAGSSIFSGDVQIEGTLRGASPLRISPSIQFESDGDTVIMKIDTIDGGLSLNYRVHIHSKDNKPGSICLHPGTLMPIVNNTFGYRLWADSTIDKPRWLLPNSDTSIKVNYLFVMEDNSGNVEIAGNLTNSDTVFSDVFQSNIAVSSINNGLVTKCGCSNVADDGTIVLPDATTQDLKVWVDGDDEWALAAIQADGTVTLPVTVGSVVNTDTDVNLCIYDSGTGATIKNRLGSSKVICYESKYKQ